MKNYVFEYYNDSEPADRNTPMDKSVMDAWNAWFGGLGSSVIDAGNPFNSNGMVVEKSGVSHIEKHPASGYTIVKAQSMEDAVEMAEGCPVLNQKNGAVRVYETLPM
jgi:hypothetical protein